MPRRRRHKGGEDHHSSPPWETLRQEPTRPLPDLGPEILDDLFERLMIDEEWSVRSERSFTWWPYQLAQHVWVTPPREAFGDPTVTVRVRSDCIRDPAVDDSVVEQMVAFLNMHASLCAYVWDPEARTVTVETSGYFYEGNLPLMPFFSAAALFSAVEAHAKASFLATALSGQPATTAHPTSGPRPKPDDLMHFVEGTVVPRGEQASAFIGRELEMASNVPAGWVLTTPSTRSFTGELPFFGDLPAVFQIALGMDPSIQTSLVQALTEPVHPDYGSGLLIVLHLPIVQPAEEIRRLAHGLNRAESLELTGFPLFGAWCPEPGDDEALAFATFVPSALAMPGLISTLLFYTSLRNAWARDRLAPKSA